MKLVYSLLLLLGISVILAVVSTFIYLAFYNNYLSNRVKNGINKKTNSKKFIDPIKIFSICFLLFYILLCFFISVRVTDPKTFIKSVKLEVCDSNSLVGNFSCNSELSGYTRYEKPVDNIRCIYYINNDKNSVFPAVLIYIDSSDKYSFDYHINDRSNISTPDQSISSEGAEWYALKDSPDDCTLVISFITNSKNDTLHIEL